MPGLTLSRMPRASSSTATTRKAAARAIPKAMRSVARRKLDALNAATTLLELSVPPNNRLKPLQGGRKGKYTIRINDQFRIEFAWKDGVASDVRAGDFH